MTLAEYRKAHGLTLVKMAEMLSIHYTHVRRVERMEQTPSRELIARIAQVTGGAVQPNDLFPSLASTDASETGGVPASAGRVAGDPPSP